MGQYVSPKEHLTHEMACIQGIKTISTSKSRQILQTGPRDSTDFDDVGVGEVDNELVAEATAESSSEWQFKVSSAKLDKTWFCLKKVKLMIADRLNK